MTVTTDQRVPETALRVVGVGAGLAGVAAVVKLKQLTITFACPALIAPASKAAAASGRETSALPRFTICVAAPGVIRVTPDNHDAVLPAPKVFAVPRVSRSATNRTRSASKSPIR